MTATLVLDPGYHFQALSRRFADDGWQLVERAQEPILPDEPEFAVFELGDERVVYTFNPVCLLRVLDCAAVRRPQRMPGVPAVGGDTVRRWLAAGDEQVVLRGVLAGGQLGDPALVASIRRHMQHPRRAISAAAVRTVAELEGSADGVRPPPTSEREVLAQAEALVAIDVLEQQLAALLYALAQDRGGDRVETLRPTPDDYLLAFSPEAAETARAAYEQLWASPLRVARSAPDSRVECHVAPAGMLAYENELSRYFPGGYRTIAPLLRPDRVWVAWKLFEPGQTAGMAYDGLAWLANRWVWFPKPYRVLRTRTAPPPTMT